MRRLRFATALTTVGVMAATLVGTASAAQAAPPDRCTANLLALTPGWNVSCTKAKSVTITTTTDAMNNTVPQRPAHQDLTLDQRVTPDAPWVDGLAFPASWFIFQTCSTVSANHTLLASTCFSRSSTPTAPCGVGALGGLDPIWQFGCPRGDSNISVDVSYRYTLAGSSTVLSDHKVFSYAVPQFQIITDGFTPPAGATIVDSTVTVSDSITGESLGTATSSRLARIDSVG